MRIFSGIQPSGDAHIGNYSGGFRQYAATQERGEAFFCIVDLHAITLQHDPEALRQGTLDITAWLFATGLDPERSTVFVQSHVTAHAEAAWLLSSVTSYGQLGRMTQFKEKSAEEEFVSAALFTYPVLMAGDILLYQTDIVPIGDDQRQHLELSRDIAQRFNSRYGETFVVPEGRVPGDGRPRDEPAGARREDVQVARRRERDGPDARPARDDPEEGQVAPSRTPARDVRYDPDEKPGISNLIELMTVVTGDSIQEVEARYDGSGYGQFKGDVADAIVEVLDADPGALPRAAQRRPAELQRLLELGAEKARASSAPTLALMYERMGFVARPSRLRDDPVERRHRDAARLSDAK